MGVSVINQSIKFFTIFLLAFSVFAGGDDRDKEYYENLDEELANFEAQLAEDLANQAALEYDALVEERMEALQNEIDVAAFEEALAAKLARQAAESAAAEITAEILAEEEFAKRLAEFQAKLEAEKAAAARSTAIYQARLQQEQIIKDNQAKREAKLAEEKAAAAAAAAEAAELAAFKAELARYEDCKAVLNLSDSNIALFKSALAADNLFSVGLQITAGTEFTANRWDEYASCIGGVLDYKNPF